MRQRSELQSFDWLLVGFYLALVVFGWFMIYAASVDIDQAGQAPGFFDLSKSYGRQMLWIMAAFVVGSFALMIELKFYRTFAPFFYGFSMLLLFAVLFTSPVNGASSWFNIGGFRFQPSEFAKLTTCLMLAAVLSSSDLGLQKRSSQLKAVGLILLPMLLILKQADAGSALIFTSFFILLFRAGMPAWIYALTVSMAVLAILSLLADTPWLLITMLIGLSNIILLRQLNVSRLWNIPLVIAVGASWLFFEPDLQWYLLAGQSAVLLILTALNYWRKSGPFVFLVLTSLAVAAGFVSSVNYIFYRVLKPYQQERVLVWLRPDQCDPQGSLYNIEQSKYAIGSGGFWGKGFLEGERTKLNYVPEQSTDFIFCTVGEEQGFIGTLFLVGLFTALLLRILFIAERQRSSFSRYYAYGVAGLIFFHLFINVGMTMNLVPVIGIPLPFISYGGSSLISFTLLLAILLKMDSNRLLVFR